MKKSLFVVLTCFCISVKLEKLKYKALTAINDIIHRDFATFSGRIDVLSSIESHDLIDQLLRLKNESLAIKLKSFEDDIIKLDTSSVLLFNSLAHFEENVGKIFWKTQRSKNYRHLVYIPDASSKDIEESVIDGFQIDNVAFFVNETEKSIDLATSFMFTKNKCRQNQLITINSFGTKTLDWKSEDFFPEKYANIHACSFTFATAECPEQSFGLNSRILIELSKDLNFEIERVCAKTMQQLSDFVITDRFDFHDFLVGYSGTDWIHILISSERGVYIVPPGKPLTQLEKLLLPFDRQTWIGIVATLTAAFVTIQVVSFTSKRLKYRSFGQAVGSPTMNLLNVFLCGNQTKVPKASTARFVFLSFLLWSMIIRTCFQSLSYRALQMDNRHQSLETFEDIFVNNFSQYIAYKGIISNEIFREVFYK